MTGMYVIATSFRAALFRDTPEAPTLLSAPIAKN
jgi:hypothetical protein